VARHTDPAGIAPKPQRASQETVQRTTGRLPFQQDSKRRFTFRQGFRGTRDAHSCGDRSCSEERAWFYDRRPAGIPLA
jgi:hypothetical protein